jgi:hypothetical protein
MNHPEFPAPTKLNGCLYWERGEIENYKRELLGLPAETRQTAIELVPAKQVTKELGVATNLQRLGVQLEVTKAVLNQVSGSRAGSVGVYQRHEYSTAKRAALEAWARRLGVVVKGEAAANIVPSPGGRTRLDKPEHRNLCEI